MENHPKVLGSWGGIRTRIPEQLHGSEGGKIDAKIPEESLPRSLQVLSLLAKIAGISSLFVVAVVILWLLWYVVELLIAPT